MKQWYIVGICQLVFGWLKSWHSLCVSVCWVASMQLGLSHGKELLCTWLAIVGVVSASQFYDVSHTLYLAAALVVALLWRRGWGWYWYSGRGRGPNARPSSRQLATSVKVIHRPRDARVVVDVEQQLFFSYRAHAHHSTKPTNVTIYSHQLRSSSASELGI